MFQNDLSHHRFLDPEREDLKELSSFLFQNSVINLRFLSPFVAFRTKASKGFKDSSNQSSTIHETLLLNKSVKIQGI